MLKGILFDYSGTIVVADRFDVETGFRNVFAQGPLPNGQTGDEALRSAVDLELEFQNMRNQTVLEFSFRGLLRVLLDLLQIDTARSIADLESVYYQAAAQYQPVDGIQSFLWESEKAGLRLGVISTTTHSIEVIRWQLDECQLVDHFPIVISSADYGIRKQHPLLFRIGLSRMNLSETEVVYVGDNLEFDIATAQKAGLRAIWYSAKKKPKTKVSPDHTIESLRDLSCSDIERITERQPGHRAVRNVGFQLPGGIDRLKPWSEIGAAAHAAVILSPLEKASCHGDNREASGNKESPKF